MTEALFEVVYPTSTSFLEDGLCTLSTPYPKQLHPFVCLSFCLYVVAEHTEAVDNPLHEAAKRGEKLSTLHFANFILEIL